MIVDSFSFAGEMDMLEIRFNLLDKYVDRFVISEGPETFSGQPKPLFWAERDKERFKKWEDKVVYVVAKFGENDRLMGMIHRRPSYVGKIPFQRAFYQKESVTEGMKGLRDEDIVYFSDVDEVWKPKEIDDKVYKLRQLAYSYYLNNRSSEDWRGTIVTKYKNVKNGCLNDMRANPENILEDGGWHWTNLGGLEAVLKKISTYDHCDEVNMPWVREGMKERIEKNIDFLNRQTDWLGNPFKLWIDESDLPQFLLDNRDTYKHLWKF